VLRGNEAKLRAQILVVDDDAVSCELISELLRSAEFNVTSLTSSPEAAERLSDDKFHAVFLDMRMPPPDGLELARHARNSRINAPAVIVMITAEHDHTLMKRAFEIGVQFFLFKPVERNKLLKLIRVAEHSIEQERRRFTRVSLQRPVSLHTNDKQLEGTTVDISFDGMLVQSYLVFPAGTYITLSLDLQNGSKPIQLEARVLRAIGSERMAVQFKGRNETERNRLQELLLPLILSAP
jgi:CheY-like chemotaxis protein